jgi:LacI family transcriptional regulator, repressor for deo operon, udp, cdd, tsx, nupC, and nupG
VRRLGLTVPGDVSVIGFDDSALMACTDPPLTTTRQPIDAMGRAVVTTLVHQVEGLSVAAEELLFEPELVVRGSTAPTARRIAAG